MAESGDSVLSLLEWNVEYCYLIVIFLLNSAAGKMSYLKHFTYLKKRKVSYKHSNWIHLHPSLYQSNAANLTYRTNFIRFFPQNIGIFFSIYGVPKEKRAVYYFLSVF